MGTSSARRAPTTWSWRRAKGAANRYLAPEGAGLAAREVVARYLAALKEDAAAEGQGLPAAFRLTRSAAQNLGAFCGRVSARGWEEALEAQGITVAAGKVGEGGVLALAAGLTAADGSLEGAVARSSLAAVLREIGPGRYISAAELVAQFLAEALYQRLILDLGESLEARGVNFGHWRQGLAGLQACIAGAAAAASADNPPPENWRGLNGWTWVTRSLERMLQRLL